MRKKFRKGTDQKENADSRKNNPCGRKYLREMDIRVVSGRKWYGIHEADTLAKGGGKCIENVDYWNEPL